MKARRTGAVFGTVAGDVTVVALMLYVVSYVYRAGEELAAIALGSVVALYAAIWLVRNIQYGYKPWEPVIWTTVNPDELDAEEHQRALRWTLVLKFIQVVGAIAGLTMVFVAGLENLGYVLVIGGFPALLVTLYKHYSHETRPWHPSVPRLWTDYTDS